MNTDHLPGLERAQSVGTGVVSQDRDMLRLASWVDGDFHNPARGLCRQRRPIRRKQLGEHPPVYQGD